MTTVSDVYALIRARLLANQPSGLTFYRWQNEVEASDGSRVIPTTAVPFAFVVFDPNRAFVAGFGGGRGANLYRNTAVIAIYVFTPTGTGVEFTTALAEQIAVLFRSYRDGTISCFEASVLPAGPGSDRAPPGLRAGELGNYWCATVAIEAFFDQIG